MGPQTPTAAACLPGKRQALAGTCQKKCMLACIYHKLLAKTLMCCRLSSIVCSLPLYRALWLYNLPGDNLDPSSLVSGGCLLCPHTSGPASRKLHTCTGTGHSYPSKTWYMPCWGSRILQSAALRILLCTSYVSQSLKSLCSLTSNLLILHPFCYSFLSMFHCLMES